jgi:hypothetical protein
VDQASSEGFAATNDRNRRETALFKSAALAPAVTSALLFIGVLFTKDAPHTATEVLWTAALFLGFGTVMGFPVSLVLLAAAFRIARKFPSRLALVGMAVLAAVLHTEMGIFIGRFISDSSIFGLIGFTWELSAWHLNPSIIIYPTIAKVIGGICAGAIYATSLPASNR